MLNLFILIQLIYQMYDLSFARPAEFIRGRDQLS